MHMIAAYLKNLVIVKQVQRRCLTFPRAGKCREKSERFQSRDKDGEARQAAHSRIQLKSPTATCDQFSDSETSIPLVDHHTSLDLENFIRGKNIFVWIFYVGPMYMCVPACRNGLPAFSVVGAWLPEALSIISRRRARLSPGAPCESKQQPSRARGLHVGENDWKMRPLFAWPRGGEGGCSWTRKLLPSFWLLASLDWLQQVLLLCEWS